uniref:Mesp transcription factor protein n=1 Tax=Phallusia mammillata TaxID=59560 RepID=A0A6F9DL53_9ASCI|nr:Mesp transcription factor protein [Phallusia mammillata]
MDFDALVDSWLTEYQENNHSSCHGNDLSTTQVSNEIKMSQFTQQRHITAQPGTLAELPLNLLSYLNQQYNTETKLSKKATQCPDNNFQNQRFQYFAEKPKQHVATACVQQLQYDEPTRENRQCKYSTNQRSVRYRSILTNEELENRSAKRRAASEREKIRMQKVTGQLLKLKQHLPDSLFENRNPSKIAILRQAIYYIDTLSKTLRDSDDEDVQMFFSQ